MEDIIFSQKNHLGLITLNRQSALNALTLPMILALKAQLLDWQSNNEIHAVVVMAAPGKAFCAGGDVRWLWEMGSRRDPQQMQFFEEEYQLNSLIHDYEKPYIALMDGLTMGGGVGVSLHGSHTVGSERFVFAMPETTIGFFPDIGASYLLSRCPDQTGIYLGLTGQRLDIASACALGLVQQFIPSDAFTQVIEHLSNMDLSSFDAHSKITTCLTSYAKPVGEASITLQRNNIHHCFNHEKMELIMEALASGSSEWHRETYHLLLQKSPLSLKITLAQLQKAKYLSFHACMTLDRCLVEHFMLQHDFYEGVRALLIDKDKLPRWQHKNVNEVTAQEVECYFGISM